MFIVPVMVVMPVMPVFSVMVYWRHKRRPRFLLFRHRLCAREVGRKKGHGRGIDQGRAGEGQKEEGLCLCQTRDAVLHVSLVWELGLENRGTSCSATQVAVMGKRGGGRGAENG